MKLPRTLQIGPHIHTPDDGRGVRYVKVNGNVVKGCFFADTRKGKIRAFVMPIRTNRWRKRAIWRTAYGKVEVFFTPAPREDHA